VLRSLDDGDGPSPTAPSCRRKTTRRLCRSSRRPWDISKPSCSRQPVRNAWTLSVGVLTFTDADPRGIKIHPGAATSAAMGSATPSGCQMDDDPGDSD